jgi:hypothetical protein
VGLYRLLRSLPKRRMMALAYCLLVGLLFLPAHYERAKDISELMCQVLGSRRPFSELRALRKRIDTLNPVNVCLLHGPDGFLPRSHLPGALYPRPFVNQWKGSGYFEVPPQSSIQVEALGPGTLFLIYGEPPIEPPLERLPMGYAIVDGSRPLIFQVTAPNTVETWVGHRAAWVGNEPVQLEVFSPRAGPAVLVFLTVPGPSLPGTTQRTVRLTGPGGAHEQTVDATFASEIRLPVDLPAGISRLELSCLDRPTATIPGDARTMLFGLVQAKLEPVDALRP